VAPATGTALLVLVAFVLPGFVAVLIGERTHEVPVRNRSPFDLLLLTGYYSVLTYGLVALLTWPFGLSRETLRDWYREESLGRLGTLGLAAIVVVPALLATCARLWMRSRMRSWLLRRLGIHEMHRVSAAWDGFFGRGELALVRVVLTDGRVVGGFYGSRSVVGHADHGGDLLLEQAWVLDEDDWFQAPAPGSGGLWIPGRVIVSMELYDAPQEGARATR
jgi:Family of unknown function (DUF6338)